LPKDGFTEDPLQFLVKSKLDDLVSVIVLHPMTSNPSPSENSSEAISLSYPQGFAAAMGFDPDQPAKIDAPFPIVGIAASAGGLEAFTQLLNHLPIDTGMGFVLIQHLDPNHESLVVHQILTKFIRHSATPHTESL